MLGKCCHEELTAGELIKLNEFVCLVRLLDRAWTTHYGRNAALGEETSFGSEIDFSCRALASQCTCERDRVGIDIHLKVRKGGPLLPPESSRRVHCLHRRL